MDDLSEDRVCLSIPRNLLVSPVKGRSQPVNQQSRQTTRDETVILGVSEPKVSEKVYGESDPNF